jgi:hypothetical protein
LLLDGRCFGCLLPSPRSHCLLLYCVWRS